MAQCHGDHSLNPRAPLPFYKVPWLNTNRRGQTPYLFIHGNLSSSHIYQERSLAAKFTSQLQAPHQWDHQQGETLPLRAELLHEV